MAAEDMTDALRSLMLLSGDMTDALRSLMLLSGDMRSPVRLKNTAVH